MSSLRIIVAAALLLAASPALAAKVGETARPFTVTTFDKQKIESGSLRGKVIVLNYWATWCAPCRRELPEMDAYVRRHRGAALQVFAVATEDSVPKAKLMPLANVLSFPLIARLKGHGFGILQGVPTNYVIDKAGVVRYAQAGAFDAATLEAVITPLLSEAAPAATTVADASR